MAGSFQKYGALVDNLELQTQINSLMKTALGNDTEALHAREKARVLLGLDELNWSYFFYLYQGRQGGRKTKPLQMYEEGKSTAGKLTAYPVSIAPAELVQHLKMVEYAQLRRSAERYDETAKGAALWVKKMQAGSGSSMTRKSYLSHRLGISEDQVKIGAKGTDLFVDVKDPRRDSGTISIPIAEAQILQSIKDHERGEIGEVIFHDIVSSETDEAILKLWEKRSLYNPNETYDEIMHQTPGLSRSGVTYQSFVPTLDEKGEISFNRKAPAGHALFAVDALRAAYRPELRPKTQKPLVAAISNGEDLSSAPDRFMVGYVVKSKVPIALITTERTPVDLKGGIISLLQDDDGVVSLTVLETAQAKEAGQEKLFASIQGIVSTNLTLFNYDVLVPMLTKEVEEIGEDEFLKIISPDLISNVKEQKDSDGVTRKYLQLEGAMGSTIMNLDRYWRRKYGMPLVHIINVDRRSRSDFFSPIKSAFDYFMQFHSDRFSFDSGTMRLKNLRRGELPEVTLKDPASKDKFYQDVENVLGAFGGASIKELDQLSVDGQVKMTGAELRGSVQVVNHSGSQIDLNELLPKSGGRIILENTVVRIGTDGRLERKSA
ncbi:MAG: UTP--glucose-1-phosphate uridylyltransferase [Bdellovibrionia bacterium]